MVDIPRDIDLVVNHLTPWVADKPWAQTAGLSPDQASNLLEGRDTVLQVVQEMRDKILQLDLSTRQGISPSTEEMLAVEWQILGNYVASFVVYFAHEDDRYNREHRAVYLFVVDVISQIMFNYGLCWMTEALAQQKRVYEIDSSVKATNVPISWEAIDNYLRQMNDSALLYEDYPAHYESKLMAQLATTQKSGQLEYHMALLALLRYLTGMREVLTDESMDQKDDRLMTMEAQTAYIIEVCKEIQENHHIMALGQLRAGDESRRSHLARCQMAK